MSGTIAIYGINNLGKTTQAAKLVDALTIEVPGFGVTTAITIKFPVYKLEPTGSILSGYLRESNPHDLTPREAQLIYTQNRLAFMPQLEVLRREHNFIVLEDYTGTGIAWGAAAGVDVEFLIRMNEGLFVEDLAVLLDGEIFNSGKESGHKHEGDDDLTTRCRKIHLELAERFGWHVVNANQTKQAVHDDILRVVSDRFER